MPTIFDADIDPAAEILLDGDGHVMMMHEEPMIRLGHGIGGDDVVFGRRSICAEEAVQRRQVGSHGGGVTTQDGSRRFDEAFGVGSYIIETPASATTSHRPPASPAA